MIRIYTKGQIALATLLGGPIATIYLLQNNFKKFHDAKSAKNTIIFGIIIGLGIGILTNFLPYNLVVIISEIIIIPIIGYKITDLLQGQQISDHLKEHGKKESTIKAILIALICLALTLIIGYSLAFIVVFLFPSLI